jgi:hypothetical protein
LPAPHFGRSVPSRIRPLHRGACSRRYLPLLRSSSATSFANALAKAASAPRPTAVRRARSLKAFAHARLIGRESPRKCSVPIREALAPQTKSAPAWGKPEPWLVGNAEIVDQSRQRAEGSIRRSSTRRKNPGGMWCRRGLSPELASSRSFGTDREDRQLPREFRGGLRRPLITIANRPYPPQPSGSTQSEHTSNSQKRP